MIIQAPRFNNAHFSALAWNDPIYPQKLSRVIPLQSASHVADTSMQVLP